MPPSRRRSQVVKRRRLLVMGMAIAMVALGVWANYPSLHALVDARARLDKVNASVEELSAQKAQLQAELARLSEADYLESLARQDLSYARPGEELFIVTGADDGAVSTPQTSEGSTGDAGISGGGSGTTSQTGERGFLQRALASLLD